MLNDTTLTSYLAEYLGYFDAISLHFRAINFMQDIALTDILCLLSVIA